jgi:hypothetical protein
MFQAPSPYSVRAIQLFFRLTPSRDLIEEAVYRLDTVTLEDRHVESNDQRFWRLG